MSSCVEVSQIGAVTYSIDDPDDSWIETPPDYFGPDLVAAIQKAQLAGLVMIPLGEGGYEPTYTDTATRFYLAEAE